MKIPLRFTVVLTLLITLLALTESRRKPSGNVALFRNLYRSVIRGTQILRDVAEGVGAVSLAINAIDEFFDVIGEDTASDSKKEKDSLTSEDVKECKPDTKAAICDNSDKLKEIQEEQLTQINDGEENEPVIPIEDHVDKFDGCGALGLHIKTTHLPLAKLTSCCTEHNTCYASKCGASKRSCDRSLRTCLYGVCDGDQNMTRTKQRSCDAAAKILFSGSMALSFQQYDEAQMLLKCSGQ